MFQIFDCEQNSEAWHEYRRGIPTASKFATVMAKGKTAGGVSLTRRKYLYELAGEIITGQPMDSFSNGHMERGHALEDEARNLYAFMKDVEPKPVGFIRNGPKGCSPDSLIGEDGMVEIKTRLAHLQVELLLRDEIPPEHKAQIQGQMWVAEREWVDVAIYSPGLPLFVKRAVRDVAYIADMAKAVDLFNEELAETVEKIRSYGAAA